MSNANELDKSSPKISEHLRPWYDELQLKLKASRIAVIEVDAGSDFDKFYFLTEELKKCFLGLGFQSEVYGVHQLQSINSPPSHSFRVTVVRR